MIQKNELVMSRKAWKRAHARLSVYHGMLWPHQTRRIAERLDQNPNESDQTVIWLRFRDERTAQWIRTLGRES